MRLSLLIVVCLAVTPTYTQTVTASPSGATTSDPPSYVPFAESDAPSLTPTFSSAEDRPCAAQENVFRVCLNTTMSLQEAGTCDDCVAVSFPEPSNECPVFQSSVCTALARDCDCGECTADIESYINCALEEAGRDNCELGCSYDTCDAAQFQFTSCMEVAGFAEDGISSCVDCSRNALANGGPVEDCAEATNRVCPAIASDCGCGSCRAELEMYMSCDAVGKEIPSDCTLDCGLDTVASDRETDDLAAQDNSSTTTLSMIVSIGLLFLTLWL